MPRSSEDIGEEICDSLRPLRRRIGVDAIRPDVENALQFFREQVPFVLSVPPGRQLAKRAAKARAALASYADLAEFAPALATLDMQLQRLERSFGPVPQFGRLKWFSADCARILIVEFSSRPPSGTVDSPLRTIASLIYEYLTGCPDADLKRACDSVLKKWNRKGSDPGDMSLFEWNALVRARNKQEP